MGEKIYCESLRIIVAAWDGKPDSFRASVLRGMIHFVELYHGEFSEERLVRALGSVHPMEIYRVGRDNPAKLPGSRKSVLDGIMILRSSSMFHWRSLKNLRVIRSRCVLRVGGKRTLNKHPLRGWVLRMGESSFLTKLLVKL